MKPLQGDSVNVNSCSCTSCDSRSESDCQTLKRLLVQGSKINKLLTGKYYVHLRESDLLDKLNKTRALYDALRSQLLSSNESSTADLKPRQSSREIRKAFVEAKKSSDIFALVDLVDKGAVLGLRKLSECCSCCTCSSKFRLHENVQKGRRNRLAYAGGNIASRSSFVSKQETGEAKNIKSDPCTCAGFKKEQIKKNRELLEKVCPAKSIVKRDHLSTPSNDLNLMSINNANLRKSYHKLKRAKACPSPYMENIGEGGSKIVKKSNTIKKKGSIVLLKTTKNVKYNLQTNRKALLKKEPEVRSTTKVGGNGQVPISKFKQKVSYRSTKINLPLEENSHIRDASSTSSTSILKEISFITSHERQKCHSRAKQRNKKHALAKSNTKITEQPILNEEPYSIKRSNQVQHSKECKISSQKDPVDEDKKNKKMLPYSFSPGKELINSNIATVSISSVKKRYPASHKKSSSNSFNKINKSNLKTRSSILFRKRLILSTPLHFRPRPLIREEPRQFQEPVRHKIPLDSEKLCPCDNCLLRTSTREREVPPALSLSEEPGRRKKASKVKHKKNKSGSHGLKRCLCNIKFKINETKPRISKNVTNENLLNDKQRIPSKSLLSSVKTFTKASNNDPDISVQADKCEGSDYVRQTQAIRKNKQATPNETNAHFEITYNSADTNESIEPSPAQDIFNKTKLSIHALISDCVCKEVEQFMYKHYGKPNINVGEKCRKIQDEHAIIDSSNHIVPNCECFDENIVSDEINKSKDQGKSNSRLRIKSTLKDASITTEKPWKLQNQAVQTVMNSTTFKTHKQKREKSLKQLEKKITYGSNPRFSIELLNTDCFNDGLKITQSKVRCVYKCSEGISQLPNKRLQTSTTTTTKHDSPRIKNIHSVLISQNSKMLTPVLKKNKTKLPDMSTHRIRPHLSRKFYNNKRTSCLNCPVDKDNKIKQDSKTLKNDTENPQKIILLENTITGKEQSLLLDLTNKPCLCTSKQRKKEKYCRKSSVVNADTKSDKIKPGFQNDAKVTKCKYSNQLSKCKCNLDEYSEQNKSNNQFQILTKKTKIKSESSDKQLRSIPKLLFFKSDIQQRNSSLQSFKKMQINSESSHQPQYAKEIYLDNFFKQNVRMASNFSFNIEFYKSITSENNYYQNRTTNMNDHCINNKQESNFLTKRYSSSRLIHLGNKKVSPINRCFCTLEISKMDEQRRNTKLLSPFRTKNPAQVYAMSTVTIAENEIKTPEILKVDHNFHCINSYHSASYSKNISSHIKHWQYFNKNPTCGFSISMIAFKAKNIQSYIRESKYKLLEIRSREQSLLDFDSNVFESAFSCEVDYLKNICSKKQPIIRNEHSQNNSIAISQHNALANQSQLTGVQPLLRRCYCTMNIQVARQKRKLLDYECEPGICIPGECDPYECQKLIMKRLMRKVSKMSGTDSRSKSSGIETASTESRSRRLQSGLGRQPKYRTRGHHARSRPSPPQGLKYQTLPRSTVAPAHRHAVKVGSTFSFDIEFSKGSAKSAPPTTDVVKLPTRHVSSRSSTTYRRHGTDRGTRHSSGRHHRETQSMMKQMRHRASSVTPMLKRCFCTLKLQKKGRQQKELELRTTHQGTSTPPKFDVESPVLRTSERGQNTKKKRKFQELLPYECEPGICIPGECDPYECLELIKKRNKHTKDFGTDSMTSSTSSSSMTSGHKRKMKRIQARNIRPKQVRSSYTSVRSKPSVMTIDTINRQGQDRQITKPSRQAVKISSNFSFNIEFYKDQTGGSIVSDRRPSEVYVHKAPKEVRRVPKMVHTQRRMREGSSQSGTSSRDDDSQIGIFQRGQSTMTSGFLKRCFCTAKLQGYNIDAGTAARRPPSKLKRCFCTLKLLSASKRNRIKDGGVGHERATSVAMTQTRRRGPPFGCVSDCEGAVRMQTKERFSGLLPYECEPGVCDPDNCDPYECIKLIRKRLAKEKMTGTEGPRTKSTSSYFSSANPSRARMTQYRSAWPKTRMTQSRPPRRRGRGRRRDYDSSESVHQDKIVTSASPQRQAVRIGSNFSFNIEFYKDKGPNNLEGQMAAPVIKRYRRPVSMRDRGHGAYRRARTRDKGFRGRRLPSLSRDTQMESIQSRDVGLGPMLRRCFCTLKLQQKSKAKGKTKAVSKTESKAGSKAENKAETSTETKAEVKAETKTVQKETDSQKQKKANHKCLCDQTNKKNECTCTPPIKEVATLHDKSITTSKKPKEVIVAAKKTKENVMKKRKAYPYKLEPYECEPGICVPGECDPYECLKLINKRLMNSSGTSTDRRRTRSSSNMAVCTNRDCAAQSYIRHKKKMRTRDTYTRHRSPWPRMPQPRKTRRRGRGRRRDYALSESVLQEKTVTSVSPQRQAVRIGSNFSFNIEFYKDKSPNNLEVQVSAPVVKRHRRPVSMRDRGHGAHRRTRTRDRGLRGRRFPSLSRDSQMDSIQSRDVGLGPILRRCFCTLKLQQKSKAKGKTKAVSKTESKAGSKAENKAETSTETKAEVKAETKTVQKETDSQKQRKANHKCLCDQTNKKNECTCTPPIKEVATLHDKSITTSKKPKEVIVAAKKTKENIMKKRKAYPYKLEPYECEPGICVPGECDPYECLKLINKRLMYSSGTSTDRRGTRSTSNMAVCTNRDCEAQSYIQRKKQMRTKNTYTRHRERRPHRDKRPHDRRPHERRVHERRPHRERRPESRSSELRSIDVEKPTRQAVKIGSNFNFDIEFSKDKSNGGAAIINSKPIKQYAAYNKARRTSSRSTEGPSTNYRNQKAQRYKENRDIDSQASGPSMRSNMTGTVAPFLKRCFCTLQLNCRTENQGTPFECLVKPEAIQFSVNRSDKNKHSRKQAQFHDRKPCPKLLPYECEPGFCVPGECDPYECMKRIKKRMQSKQVGTIFRSRSFSSSTGEGKKYRPRRIQTRSSTPHRRRNVKTYRRYDQSKDDSRSRTISSSSDERRYRPRMKTRSYTPGRQKHKTIRDDDKSQHDTSSYQQAEGVCDAKPKRQIVRIGSNFNFDIEFFKENSPQSPCKPQDNNITKKDRKKRWSGKRGRAKRLTNTRTISSDEKNYKRRRAAKRETMTRAISTKSMSSYSKKYNPRDIQSQSEYKKTYSRGIGTPLLKRCFCTLKLEKKGKRRQFNTRKIEPTFKTSSKKMEPSFKCVSKKIEPSFKCVSKKMEPTTKCVSTHTKSKTKAIIEPVAPIIGIKPKTCECDKGRKGHKCKCNLNTCECKNRKKNKNCKCYEKCECVEEPPPPKKPSSIFTCKRSTAKDFPCKKGNECKCCKCNTNFMKTNEYRCKKGDICKCPICNTPALEPNEFPCKKGKNCKCCKCNTYFGKTSKYQCKKGEICKCPICNTPALEQNENINNMKQNQNNIPLKQDQDFSPVNQDKCKCNKSKNKCKCNTQKRSKCLCEKVSQKIMPVKQDQNVISVKQDKFPCKKGKECKCCRCNPPGLEPNEFPCKKGKNCKCCRCNPPGLEPNEFPCKKGKNCKCCKCSTPVLDPNEFPCKKGKECKCCRCNPPGQGANGYPCKKGINCKCCKCNTLLKQNQNNIPTNQDNFPCKKGKECKCCTCSTYSMKVIKYRCKKGEVCKCPICDTPALEPNENKHPIKQDQNIIPVNQDTCRCNKSKNKCKCVTQGDKGKNCKCKQNKKNKNCKCFESCECEAEVPPPKKPSTPFTCKPSKPFTCKPSKPFTCNPSTQFTCKTADKKTSTKKKYDPLKQIDIRDDCGVCKSPYECLKRGIRRMYRPSGKRLKRRPRMSVSSIAATIVPGYTHKRTKYKGEPYSPDQIETVVEQPRYPFLQAKDARQGVKISSNFSFDIEFFKEMLPPMMDNVKEIDEDRKGKTKNRIKENYRAGDTRSAHHGARNYSKYDNDSDSEPDRKSSPFEVLKKCFCTTKLQRSNYTQCLTVGRVQEIRPMSYFGPKEYLVQYQMQQPTRKHFKTNSQELKTIMSYRPRKYNKVYNNKRCYCHKCFNCANPTIQGTQCIPKQAKVKETTFKKMLNICKHLFTKRSNKIDANKSEGWTESKKEATNQKPLIDILKASKSERHPKRVATAEIKKTKSLKVAKVSDVVYKKKYSRFQSGDNYKSQNTGIKFVKRNCKHCQNKLRQTVPVHNKVPFTKLRTATALHLKLNDPIIVGQKKDTKSISLLFKSPMFKNSKDVQYPKVCSCCGGIKRIQNLLASNCSEIKNKILECSEDTTTVIPKDFVGITKTDKPKEETTLSQENKDKNNQDRCCICKSNSKQKAMQDKSGALSVSGNVICKKEAEQCAENRNLIKYIENKSEKCICGTTICPAKSEIKVHALGSGHKSALDQKERNKEPKQEALTCENLRTAECKELIDKTMKEKYKLKKFTKVKTLDTQLVTESVLDNQDGSDTVGVSDPKSTYRKCQSCLRDHMHAWKKFQKVAFTGHGVETMRRLKLSCETRKYVKGCTGKLENHPVTDVATRFNKTDRKIGLHAKKPVWRRHSGSVFGWSPFMLSLRKRPWLSTYYKCAGVFPHCLTILQVWRQFMDIVLFMLAAAAVSPCLLGIELCKALKSCFLCKA